MRNHTLKQLSNGVHNRLPNYEIPSDGAQDALNWVSVDGGIVLASGKQILGVEGVSGEVNNLWFGTKNDGTKVLYAKYGDKIGYWNGSTLVTIVTGLTVNAIYSFQNYTSLSGNFTFATGVDGIYKFHNSNPASYISLYEEGRNFKGRCLIDKARMLMVGLKNDPTGLYGSKIDGQSTNYTLVASETLGTGDGVQTVFTGTLAFKGSNPKASCFGLKVTQGANISSDGYNGILTGNNLTIGTINYITGAYSLTFTTPVPNAQAITVAYQWENSNEGGITDFRYTTPERLASEGFIVRQDEGGDAIQKVLIGSDGAYYSAKLYSYYRFYIDSTDTKPTNEVFRKDIGIPSPDGAISAGMGIIFMNTANPNKPQMTVLEKNPLGDSLIPTVLFEHFKFENYLYDQCVLDTWDRYIIVACRTKDSSVNNRLLLCDKTANTVDITDKGMKSYAKDGNSLYGGSNLTHTIWQLFSDYDDDGSPVENVWDSKADDCNIDMLKKTRTFRFKGFIDQYQQIEVSLGYDDTAPTLIGTIRGDAEYVDRTNPSSVGGGEVGSVAIGGSEVKTIYPFYLEIKAKVPKYETRTIRFVAKNIGYASISYMEDHDILTFEGRMPKRFRLKQNVSIDGSNTNT